MSKDAKKEVGASTWTKEPPTKSGWFWLKNYEYGPAPVRLDWFCFTFDPNTRHLAVDMCMGEYQEILGHKIDDLDGEWAPLIEPGVGKIEIEHERLHAMIEHMERQARKLIETHLVSDEFVNSPRGDQMADDIYKRWFGA